MSGRLSVSFQLCCALAFALACASLCPAQTPVEVLYVNENSTLLTYDIDVQTLQPTLVGQPLKLGPVFDQVYPSPTGNTIYVLSPPLPGSADRDSTISIYATDAQGVPQTPRLQAIGPAPISSFIVDPNGRFIYAFSYDPIAGVKYLGELTYHLRLYTIDSATGTVSKPPETLASYDMSSYCAPYIVGFNTSGDELLEAVSCSYPDNASTAAYFFRSVNSDTGKLGPETELLAVNDSEAVDAVTASGSAIVDLHQQFAPFQESITVYPWATPAGGSPRAVINCTAAMLAGCGDAGGYVLDPSGRYLAVFLPNSVDIVRIDLGSKQIVDTGSTISNILQPEFSPDDRLLYAVNYQQFGDSTIQIYGFDVQTGQLTEGGQISLPPMLRNIFPAVRR